MPRGRAGPWCRALPRRRSLHFFTNAGDMTRFGGMLALSLCLASPGLAAPRLSAYGVDIAQTSVSGVSSGGAMAVQMHVAHSSIMRGIGVIAGIAYGCADLPLINQRVAQIPWCLNGAIPASFSLARTAEAVAAAAIDDPAAQLPRQNVWLFSGYNDGSVRRAAMDAVAEYYQRYATSGQTCYKTNHHAPHALITSSDGGTCLAANAKYINNCGYDAAGRLLEHIYGGLKQPRRGRLTGRVRAFDQSEFVDALNPALLGFADKGYVYVPKVCETETCRVHVVFHGCKQYAGKVGDAVYKQAVYNDWADANKLIVLYPQTIDNGRNLDGCWDWWGFNDFSPGTVTFARKSGDQIAAIKAMLDRLAEGFFAAAGATDSFGPPQDLRAPDATANSVALVWRPNGAAPSPELATAFWPMLSVPETASLPAGC